jgi:hypothetical protein
VDRREMDDRIGLEARYGLLGCGTVAQVNRSGLELALLILREAPRAITEVVECENGMPAFQQLADRLRSDKPVSTTYDDPHITSIVNPGRLAEAA